MGFSDAAVNDSLLGTAWNIRRTNTCFIRSFPMAYSVWSKTGPPCAKLFLLSFVAMSQTWSLSPVLRDYTLLTLEEVMTIYIHMGRNPQAITKLQIHTGLRVSIIPPGRCSCPDEQEEQMFADTEFTQVQLCRRMPHAGRKPSGSLAN